MKPFQERNLLTIGIVGSVLTAGIAVGAWYYDELPFVSPAESYSAYFAEAGGLTAGAQVQVSGMRVGSVNSVTLDEGRVLVRFKVDSKIRLGDRTEAAVKTKSLLGTKMLGVTPRGDGRLTETIPLQRTTPAYQLPDALGDLTATISGLDTEQLSDSLQTLAQTFQDTPPDLRIAVAGVGRLSKVLNKRDAQLRNLLSNARKVTSVLSARSDQIVHLVNDTNELLSQLNSESAALDQISTNISHVSRQLSGVVADNGQTLKPALDKLNGVLATLDNRKTEVQEYLKRFSWYAIGLGESLSSGPFFKAYVANLVPGQFIQPYIDSAFSDLGLDPNVLLPSERTDPQIGQHGTPALPIPYPRTGQGGEPRLYLPDAITGNPDDQLCGSPGSALPGTGCYPYREPPPAPPRGGPPPGPPAQAPAGSESVPEPTPSPVFVPAPGEVPATEGAHTESGAGR
ncbi:MCE family protein [Mycobacterium sp. CSUR Q5927]|nr:MCE family protein [Mycobacterium sp. CSUR Q5927]